MHARYFKQYLLHKLKKFQTKNWRIVIIENSITWTQHSMYTLQGTMHDQHFQQSSLHKFEQIQDKISAIIIATILTMKISNTNH